MNNNENMVLLKQAFLEPTAPTSAMFEDNKGKGEGKGNKGDDSNKGKKVLTDAILEAVQQMGMSNERSTCAAAVIDWAQSSSPDADSFDGLALALAGIEDDESDDDITDEQVDEYNRVLACLADCAVSFGADQADVSAMLDDDSDDAAINVADAITANNDDEDQNIAVYGVSGNDDAMLEANIKVVRAGQIVFKKKRPRPKRITSAQKAALKKARTKAHTASAKIARRKSMKIRMKRGL